jgi:hypothetical protein
MEISQKDGADIYREEASKSLYARAKMLRARKRKLTKSKDFRSHPAVNWLLMVFSG